MTFPFNAEALAEYIAAGQYYNRLVPGLGDEFADEIESESEQSSPHRALAHHRG
jgi:hypothetical protein